MKEYKFRAWDGSTLIYDGSITGSVISRFAYSDCQIYTGKWDRDGLDIYIGDVIEIYPETEDSIIEVVVWDEILSGFNSVPMPFFAGEDSVFSELWDCKDYRVLGNIFEHPNLVPNWPDKVTIVENRDITKIKKFHSTKTES